MIAVASSASSPTASHSNVEPLPLRTRPSRSRTSRQREARWTSAGRLPYRGIIHVAGINLLWFATERSLRSSCHNAIRLAEEHDCRSIALPLIGSGSGQRGRAWSQRVLLEELGTIDSDLRVTLVRYGSNANRDGS